MTPWIRSSSAALATLLLGVTAGAAPHKPRVMVMEFAPDPAFKPSAMAAFDEFLAGAVRDQGFDTITSADVAATLGLERQKQLLGCTGSSCMADLGGALGVDYLVRGVLAQLEGSEALSLSLLDAHGKTVNEVRSVARSTSSADVIATIESLVPKLVAPVRATAVSAAAPTSQAPAAGGLVESRSTEPGWSTPRKVLFGAGLGGLAAGAIFGALSVAGYQGARSDASHGVDGTSRGSTAATEGRIGVGLAVLGAAALATSFALSDSGSAP